MTERSVEHAAFTVDRDYPASPSRVFAAWSTPESKARWFAGDVAEHTLDFRVGGIERNRGGGDPDGPVLTFESTFHDIIDGERIVFSSLLMNDDAVATISVTTVELSPRGAGTRLVLTQQSTFLDGHERPDWREQGTRTQLDALETELAD